MSPMPAGSGGVNCNYCGATAAANGKGTPITLKHAPECPSSREMWCMNKKEHSAHIQQYAVAKYRCRGVTADEAIVMAVDLDRSFDYAASDWDREDAAQMVEALRPAVHGPEWVTETRSVLDLVLAERKRQVARYGFNEKLDDGTGPGVQWLRHTEINLDLMTATEIEAAFRREYERYSAQYGLPTWMHLIREEVAESFKESEPEPLITELTQVAALCVSWIERIRARRAG